MNFLSPWFLLGALAVAGPIVFHLIRRIVREKVAFSSLLFLKPAPPRQTRRRKLEHPSLLLLRCLSLLLLATAFARPFVFSNTPTPAESDRGRQVIVLVDASASLLRPGLWDRALNLVRQHLEKISPNDQVAVMTFDRELKTSTAFAEWSALPFERRTAVTMQKLKDTPPRWLDTRLGAALLSVAEQFPGDAAKAFQGQREIVLISDLQEGARINELQGHEWPAHLRISLERVDPSTPGNAGLEILGDDTRSPETGKVRVRVSNARDSDRERFQLRWENGDTNRLDLYLPPGQTRTITLALPAGPTGTLRLAGDTTEFDDRSFYAAPETVRQRIAWFGSDSVDDPATLRFYAQRVFTDTPRRQVEIVPATASAAAEALNSATLAIVTQPLNTAAAATLRSWLESGRTALLVLADAPMQTTLAALSGQAGLEVTEASGDFSLLAEIDFTHPLFASFADPRFSDFSHIHFWKHRRVRLAASPNLRVPARFDDGSPALSELTVGRGKLLVLASGWNPADSQLAVASKFPPFMESLLRFSSPAAPARFQFLTGDEIPSPATGRVRWIRPEGTSTVLDHGRAFTGTERPGIYVAEGEFTTNHFAVNLTLDESRTAPLSIDDFARLGVPISPPAAAATASIAQQQLHQAAELESRQKLWRWFLLGALAVSASEIMLSGWISRKPAPKEVAA
ncbi:MAG: BatA domain-containing protein [Verrucomicrobiota bacterium]